MDRYEEPEFPQNDSDDHDDVDYWTDLRFNVERGRPVHVTVL